MLMSDRTSWVSSNLGSIHPWAIYTVFKKVSDLVLKYFWHPFCGIMHLVICKVVAYNTNYLTQRSHMHYAKLLKCFTLEWQLCPSKPEAWPLIYCLWNKHPLPHREEKLVFLDSVWFWEMYASNVMNSSML